MCKQVHKFNRILLVHPYWHLFQVPHDFSINSSPKSWSFQRCPGSTSEAFFDVWLLIHGRWPPVAVLQYPLAKLCQVTAKLLFESIRVMFRGVLPLCCAYAHNLQSYSRSFGFLSWGWSSIPFDVCRSHFSNEAHPMRWNTIPTVGRIPWVSWRAGTRWDFSSFLMAAMVQKKSQTVHGDHVDPLTAAIWRSVVNYCEQLGSPLFHMFSGCFHFANLSPLFSSGPTTSWPIPASFWTFSTVETFPFWPKTVCAHTEKTPKVFLTEGQGRKRANVLEFSLQALLLKTCKNVSSFVCGLDLMLLTCRMTFPAWLQQVRLWVDQF